MSDLADRIAGLSPEKRALLARRLAPTPAPQGPPPVEPIAVLGIGCRFPGSSNSPEAFWRLLCNGVDAIVPVPADRWDAAALYDPDFEAPGKSTARWGGLLDRVDLFDAAFFGLSPREAAQMDPQQRLLLESAWEALEDAGQLTDRLSGSATGIFVGVENHSSDYYLMQAREAAQIDTYTTTGTAHSILPNRLSYILNLLGPSLAVDTACSSSLTAVHLACQGLRSGECDLALAAGINLMLRPELGICLTKLQMMAADGRCKTFDSRADGFVRGEGCGVIVLKRLADAVRDRDPILAVIRGSAINQDGATNGLTAPSGRSQQALIRRALAVARIEPASVGYVECHGTGTALGDPIEVEALQEVLAPGRAPGQSCALGAVKTNIGHLEAAAGIAGIIKATLALHHGAIPPNLHFQKLNPHLHLDGAPFVLPTKLVSWPSSSAPRYAGVSSFGFGGTNVHIVLGEAPQAAAPTGEQARPMLLPLSARSPAALRDLATAYQALLTETTVAAGDIAYTAAVRRLHHDHRLAVVGTSAAEWAEGLRAHLERPELQQKSEHGQTGVVFLYCGQGPQWATMGRTLLEQEPVFRDSLMRCDALLRSYTSWSVVEELTAEARRSRLSQTEVAQPALFALQVGLTELWRSWGAQPEAIVGHSVGEVAAAWAAGVLSLEDAVRVVYHRGRLMQRATGQGGMAAVGVSPEEAEQLLKHFAGRLGIAAVNSPSSVVLSGERAALEEVEATLAARGTFTRVLAVDYAFHTPQMDQYRDELVSSLRGIQVRPAEVTLVSTVTGHPATASDYGLEYWAANIRSPVLFAHAVSSLLRQGHTLFLELGPHPVLGHSVVECHSGPGGEPHCVASMRRNQDDRVALLQALGELYAAGHRVDWQRQHPSGGRCVLLPRYPWQRRRYWLPEPSTPAATPTALTVPQDWLYDVRWELRNRLAQPSARPVPLYLPSPASLVEATRRQGPSANAATVPALALGACESAAAETQAPSASAGASRADCGDVSTPTAGLLPRLDRLSIGYICQALTQLGLTFRPGTRSVADALASSVGVAAQHTRLFGRLLQVLSAEGLLAHDGAVWTVLREPEPLDISSESRQLAADFPAAAGVVALHDRCGGQLAEVLRGRVDPLALLFTGDKQSSAEAIYRDSPACRQANLLAADAVAAMVAALPPGRTLRVLEIGAGTGGTTAYVLPKLPPDRSEYVFTDLSRGLLQQAAEKFRAFPFVRYELLNIEEAPEGQGMAAGQFDLVLAANVLHATRDLGEALCHARSLLGPGGLLLLLEGTAPRLFADLTFGLTEGWWRFSDAQRRKDHPLLGVAGWRAVLEEQGLAESAALRVSEEDRPLFDQALILARKPQGETPAGRPEPVRGSVGTWLVFADDGQLGDELARRLAERQEVGVLVRRGVGHQAESDSTYRINPRLATDYERLLREVISGKRSPFQGVVYLWAMDAGSEVEELTCIAPLLLCQAIMSTGKVPAQGLWLVTLGAQPVTGSLGPHGVVQAPLWGLGRVAGLEHPGLWGGLIDLDPEAPIEAGADALLGEIDHPDGEDQVALRNGDRYLARLVPSDIPSCPPTRFRADGTYLVTGGLGGIGLELIRWLADHGARHLTLFGRRPLPDRASWDTLLPGTEDHLRTSAVRALEDRGVTVRVVAGDVGDPELLQELFEEFGKEEPELRGIFHAASTYSAASLEELDPDAVRAMMRTKVTAASALHALSLEHRVECFVLFSSSTALWGATGLAHYAAANAFLDSFAHYRRSCGLPALSVNWGTWEQMRGFSAGERDRVARFGLRPMPAHLALEALGQLLGSGATQKVVASVDWSVLKPAYEARRRRPFLAHVGRTEGQAATETTASQDLRRWLQAAPVEERRELLCAHVQARVARVLGLDATEPLDRRRGLFEMGMDSLTSVQLRRSLETDVQRPLPTTLAFNYPTVEALAGYLAREVLGLAAGEQQPTQAPADRPPKGEEVTADDAASEEDLLHELAARLEKLR
jgi:acyl transferase domain-containing protein